MTETETVWQWNCRLSPAIWKLLLWVYWYIHFLPGPSSLRSGYPNSSTTVLDLQKVLINSNKMHERISGSIFRWCIKKWPGKSACALSSLTLTEHTVCNRLWGINRSMRSDQRWGWESSGRKNNMVNVVCKGSSTLLTAQLVLLVCGVTLMASGKESHMRLPDPCEPKWLDQ